MGKVRGQSVFKAQAQKEKCPPPPRGLLRKIRRFNWEKKRGILSSGTLTIDARLLVAESTQFHQQRHITDMPDNIKKLSGFKYFLVINHKCTKRLIYSMIVKL